MSDLKTASCYVTDATTAPCNPILACISSASNFANAIIEEYAHRIYADIDLLTDWQQQRRKALTSAFGIQLFERVANSASELINVNPVPLRRADMFDVANYEREESDYSCGIRFTGHPYIIVDEILDEYSRLGEEWNSPAEEENGYLRDLIKRTYGNQLGKAIIITAHKLFKLYPFTAPDSFQE